jgi:hypothetical protein
VVRASIAAALAVTALALSGSAGTATSVERVGNSTAPVAEQSCNFAVFQELVPPEVHHTCAADHGRHRALAVCVLKNLATPPDGVKHTVAGPWVFGASTSVAACGVNEKLVDWGAEGGG